MPELRDQKIQFVRGIKWSALSALAHYAFAWLTLFAWFAAYGHIDESRSTVREGIAPVLTRTHDVLTQPLAHAIRGESNVIAHLRIVLNSLLWATGTLLLILRSHRTKRAGM